MSDLELNGRVPVLYFMQDDHDLDGMGFNVHLAGDGIACRYRSLHEALVEFRTLLNQVEVKGDEDE